MCLPWTQWDSRHHQKQNLIGCRVIFIMQTTQLQVRKVVWRQILNLRYLKDKSGTGILLLKIAPYGKASAIDFYQDTGFKSREMLLKITDII